METHILIDLNNPWYVVPVNMIPSLSDTIYPYLHVCITIKTGKFSSDIGHFISVICLLKMPHVRQGFYRKSYSMMAYLPSWRKPLA